MHVLPAVPQRIRRLALLAVLACAVAVPASAGASASAGSVTHFWASNFVATTPAPGPPTTGAYTWTWSLSPGNAASHGTVIGTDTWSCNVVVANEGGGTCVVQIAVPGSTVTSALQLLASDTDNATLAGATGTGVWRGIQTGAVLSAPNSGLTGAGGAADVTVVSDVSPRTRGVRPATVTRLFAYNAISVVTNPNPTVDTPVTTTWDLARGNATHHGRLIGTWTTVCYGEHSQFALQCNSESVLLVGGTLTGAAQPVVPEGLLGGPLGAASLFSLGGATGTGIWAKTQAGVITSVPVGATTDATLTVISY